MGCRVEGGSRIRIQVGVGVEGVGRDVCDGGVWMSLLWV